MFDKKKEEIKDAISKNIQDINDKVEVLSLTFMIATSLTVGFFAGALSSAIIYGTSRR